MPFCDGYSLVGTSGINGDAFYISPDHTTILLADGASGAGKEGKVIMSHLCTDMVKNSPFSLSGSTVKAYLDQMIWKINNQLIAISQKNKQYIFGTLVICVVQGNIATIVSIGDSPAYFIHENSIVQVAKTKKTYQNLIDMGLYTSEQLERAVHNLPEHMWSMFDRYIPMVVPSYSIDEIEMESGDVIVLCSDGIGDHIDPSSLKAILNTDHVSQSIRKVVDVAKERSIKESDCASYDDLTIVVYRHEPLFPV